ncbi:unnamed protein product [Caenorhabditis brenneri]
MKSCFLFFLVFLVVTVSGKDFCIKWQEIKPGDTCWGMIQGKMNLTLDVLKTMNKGLDCDKLQVGKKLCMAMTGFQLKCTKTHKIKSGDTCFKVWNAYGLSEMEFVDWNEGVDCNKLQVGKELCVKRL